MSARITKETKRAIAVTLLTYLSGRYEDLLDRPFIETYLRLSEQLKTLSPDSRLKAVQAGQFGRLASATSLKSFVDTVILSDDTRDIRTIHKAQGAEFKRVLVWLAEESWLDHLFDPMNVRQSEKEEQRITYVAVSRAKDKLYVASPTLSRERQDKIQALNPDIQIKRMPVHHIL